ncbi:MAG: hypothetical protein D3924_16290 [Candidatus Electrothrix sp. AR4]|nr:hypothetical protein [Candidatus Electrothrix sp. AR4]
MKTKYLIYLSVLFCSLLVKNTEANAAHTWVACTPASVATLYSSRIHIQCAQSFDGIRYFAYGTKQDPAGAARYMSMATSALISGVSIKLLYDPEDQSGTNIGCKAHDCRLLLGLEIFGAGEIGM